MKTEQNLLDEMTAECVRRELNLIGNIVNVWRLRNESLHSFSHRIALELQCSIIEREDLLKFLLSLQHHPSCNRKGEARDQ